MKAEELRLGNCAKGLFDETVSLKAIYEDGTLAWQDGKGTTYGPMKSIILNDGWLVELGFIEYHEYGRKYYDGKFEFYIYHDKIDRFHFYSYNEQSGDNSYITEIKYVHQLQNLYFALTGEELRVE